jgi:catalase
MNVRKFWTLKFPDFIHTQKRHAQTNLRSPTAMWDFWSLSPESLHQVTILFSDRGLPQTVRHMNGYGSHTYSLINAAGERFWVKFHFRTQQGHRHWTNAEAAQVVGRDADRYNHRVGNDDFSQPRAPWKLFDERQLLRLYANVAGAMAGVPAEIVDRQLALFERIQPEYAAGIAPYFLSNALSCSIGIARTVRP